MIPQQWHSSKTKMDTYVENIHKYSPAFALKVMKGIASSSVGAHACDIIAIDQVVHPYTSAWHSGQKRKLLISVAAARCLHVPQIQYYKSSMVNVCKPSIGMRLTSNSTMDRPLITLGRNNISQLEHDVLLYFIAIVSISEQRSVSLFVNSPVWNACLALTASDLIGNSILRSMPGMDNVNDSLI